jgi:hypothetical protein
MIESENLSLRLGDAPILNPKHEIRISKQMQRSEILSPKRVCLKHLNFEFVSDWSETDASLDIRVSNFEPKIQIFLARCMW